jgi:hypothetical protein
MLDASWRRTAPVPTMAFASGHDELLRHDGKRATRV